jgi:hypothetical protein
LDVVEVGVGESNQKRFLSLPGGLVIWRAEHLDDFFTLGFHTLHIFEGALLNKQRTYTVENELKTWGIFTYFC